MSFFGDLERLLVQLYPYRWLLTGATVSSFASFLLLAYRRGWHKTLWRHRLVSGVGAIVFLVVALPLGEYLLSPLFERSLLEEPSPAVVARAERNADQRIQSTPPAPPDSTFAPRVVRQGEVSGADDFHFGRGKALLIETSPGRYSLRFENFSVRNGPDLFVYLSPSSDGYSDGFLNLGGLKATDGAFNYDIPPGTDVSQFKSAIVWCRRFSVLFAAAPLA